MLKAIQIARLVMQRKDKSRPLVIAGIPHDLVDINSDPSIPYLLGLHTMHHWDLKQIERESVVASSSITPVFSSSHPSQTPVFSSSNPPEGEPAIFDEEVVESSPSARASSARTDVTTPFLSHYVGDSAVLHNIATLATPMGCRICIAQIQISSNPDLPIL